MQEIKLHSNIQKVLWTEAVEIKSNVSITISKIVIEIEAPYNTTDLIKRAIEKAGLAHILRPQIVSHNARSSLRITIPR